MSLIFCEGNTDDEATTTRYSMIWRDLRADKERIQLVQWISSVRGYYNRYMKTCLVQWISSEIKLRNVTLHQSQP